MTARKYSQSSIALVSIIQVNKHCHHGVMFVGEVVIVLVSGEGSSFLGWLQMSFGVMKNYTGALRLEDYNIYSKSI